MKSIASGQRSAPTKRCKTFLIGNGGGLNTLFDDANFATMAAEKAILCVLFEEFS